MQDLESLNVTQLRQIARDRGIGFKEPRSGGKKPFFVELIEADTSFYGELEEIGPNEPPSEGDWIIIRKENSIHRHLLPIPAQITRRYSVKSGRDPFYFKLTDLGGNQSDVYSYKPRMFKLKNFDLETANRIVYEGEAIAVGDKLLSPCNNVQSVDRIYVTKGGEGWVIMSNARVLTFAEFHAATHRDTPDRSSYSGQYTRYKGQDRNFAKIEETLTIKTSGVIKLASPEQLTVTFGLTGSPHRRWIDIAVQTETEKASLDITSYFYPEKGGFSNREKASFHPNFYNYADTAMIGILYLVNSRINSLPPSTSHRDIWGILCQLAEELRDK